MPKKRTKLGRSPIEFQIDLKVEFVEISDDEVPAWREGIKLLLKWIREAKALSKQEAESQIYEHQKTYGPQRPAHWIQGRHPPVKVPARSEG